jgi:hypothetical protein
MISATQSRIQLLKERLDNHLAIMQIQLAYLLVAKMGMIARLNVGESPAQCDVRGSIPGPWVAESQEHPVQ